MEMVAVAMIVIAYFFHKEIATLTSALSMYFLRPPASKETIQNTYENNYNTWNTCEKCKRCEPEFKTDNSPNKHFGANAGQPSTPDEPHEDTGGCPYIGGIEVKEPHENN